MYEIQKMLSLLAAVLCPDCNMAACHGTVKTLHDELSSPQCLQQSLQYHQVR